MLKIIKALPLATLALFPNVSSSNEERTVFIDTVTIAGNTEYLMIRPLYTVTKENSMGCDFIYTYTMDGVSYSGGSAHLSSLSIVTSVEPPKLSSKIYTSTLGKDCTFTVEMIPEDTSLPSEKITLHRNLTGSKCVYYNQKYNEEGLSSGFITQSYNIDPKYNITREDRIKFLNFEDNLIISSYNYFDVSTLKFQCINSRYNYPKGNFYFDFIDTYALFTDLPLVSGTMYRRLPLECIVEDNICYFTLKDELYYDEITHETSSTYKEGYSPTRKLYFPKDSYDQLKRITCRLVMDIEGFTNFTMIGEFKISHEKKLFGDCEDSEYCVHSTEDFSPNKREKEVEVNL